MEAPVKKANHWITFIVIAAVIMAVVLYHGLYKMHFQFNPNDINDYINEECAKHPEEQRPAIYQLIKEGVKDILDDRNRTKQVLVMAEANRTPREMELVHAAIMQNIAYGYLKI